MIFSCRFVFLFTHHKTTSSTSSCCRGDWPPRDAHASGAHLAFKAAYDGLRARFCLVSFLFFVSFVVNGIGGGCPILSRTVVDLCVESTTRKDEDS